MQNSAPVETGSVKHCFTASNDAQASQLPRSACTLQEARERRPTTQRPRLITIGRGPIARRLPAVELTGRERRLERLSKSLPPGAKRRALMRALRCIKQLRALEAEYARQYLVFDERNGLYLLPGSKP